MRPGVDPFGAREIAIHVEGGGIPRRVARDEVAEVAGSNAELRRRVSAPKGLAGRSGSWKQDLSAFVDDPGIDTLGRRDFLLGETRSGLTVLALRGGGIEGTRRRVGDDAILYAVLRIASGYGREAGVASRRKTDRIFEQPGVSEHG